MRPSRPVRAARRDHLRVPPRCLLLRGARCIAFAASGSSLRLPLPSRVRLAVPSGSSADRCARGAQHGKSCDVSFRPSPSSLMLNFFAGDPSLRKSVQFATAVYRLLREAADALKSEHIAGCSPGAHGVEGGPPTAFPQRSQSVPHAQALQLTNERTFFVRQLKCLPKVHAEIVRKLRKVSLSAMSAPRGARGSGRCVDATDQLLKHIVAGEDRDGRDEVTEDDVAVALRQQPQSSYGFDEDGVSRAREAEVSWVVGSDEVCRQVVIFILRISLPAHMLHKSKFSLFPAV